nr:hypothetical protein CFP56_67578 [Quercus suber]
MRYRITTLFSSSLPSPYLFSLAGSVPLKPEVESTGMTTYEEYLSTLRSLHSLIHHYSTYLAIPCSSVNRQIGYVFLPMIDIWRRGRAVEDRAAFFSQDTFCSWDSSNFPSFSSLHTQYVSGIDDRALTVGFLASGPCIHSSFLLSVHIYVHYYNTTVPTRWAGSSRTLSSWREGLNLHVFDGMKVLGCMPSCDLRLLQGGLGLGGSWWLSHRAMASLLLGVRKSFLSGGREESTGCRTRGDSFHTGNGER